MNSGRIPYRGKYRWWWIWAPLIYVPAAIFLLVMIEGYWWTTPPVPVFASVVQLAGSTPVTEEDPQRSYSYFVLLPDGKREILRTWSPHEVGDHLALSETRGRITGQIHLSETAPRFQPDHPETASIKPAD